MLLARGTPLPGESISSFRQRIWMRNGYFLYRVFPPELRRTDPDLVYRDHILSTVAEMTNSSEALISSLSLWSHPLLAAQVMSSGRKLPRWVVYLRYGRDVPGFGSQFCPACLRDAEEPYFKIHWRLSVSLTCNLHGTQLLSHCPSCLLPAWPYAAAKAVGYFERGLEIDECPRCRVRLRDCTAPTESRLSLIQAANAVLSKKSLEIPGMVAQVPVHEWFNSLRSVMNLFLHIRSRRKVSADPAFCDIAKSFEAQRIQSIPFDRLNSDARREMIASSWPLMADWPDRFLEFAKRCKVSATDFSEDRESLPPWFLRVVDSYLGQPGRSVTEAQVELAIERLRSDGLIPNKVNVSRMVGSRDAAPVIKRLGRRTKATLREVSDLAAGLRAYMASSPSVRRSSRIVRARNTTAAIVAILKKTNEAGAVSILWPELRRLISEPQMCSTHEKYLKPVLVEAVQVLTAQSALWDESADKQSYFTAHCGVHQNLRGPRTAILHAMRGADPMLWRRPHVFFEPGD